MKRNCEPLEEHKEKTDSYHVINKQSGSRKERQTAPRRTVIPERTLIHILFTRNTGRKAGSYYNTGDSRTQAEKLQKVYQGFAVGVLTRDKSLKKGSGSFCGELDTEHTEEFSVFSVILGDLCPNPGLSFLHSLERPTFLENVLLNMGQFFPRL